MRQLLYFITLTAATAHGLASAEVARALPLALFAGTPASGDTQLLLSRPAGASHLANIRAASDASAGFLRAIKERNCEAAMTQVDASALRMGSGDHPAYCARMFTSFERFGAFSAEPAFVVSGTVLVPLKPANANNWRVLTFRKTADRWLFSEAPQTGSLAPLVLSAFRAMSQGVQKAPLLANVPARTVVLDDQGAESQLALRARIAPAPAAGGPTAALMSFYAACTSQTGLKPGDLGRYRACLHPGAQLQMKAFHDAAPADRKVADYHALTASRTIDYVLIDGSRAVIFFTETASGRRWRDVVQQTGPGRFALENPMKSGAVDMVLNSERVRAAIKTQVR